jgi:DNA-binding response OmpR family regulator
MDRPLKDHSVLVVEDEALVAMEIQSSLESSGALVLGPATTLARAKELAASGHMSAAVLDLRLGTDTVEAIARLLEARGIPFLFYSGQTVDDPLLKEWPSVTFIEKPAHHRRIVEELVRLVSGRQKKN